MKSDSANLGRIFKAFGYSLQGLRAAWTHEAAFRQEVWTFSVLVPVTLALGLPALECIVLLAMMAMVLALELVNSALEAVVDKTCPEHHPLAGRAKDCGSAAVLVATSVLAISWLVLAGPAVWHVLTGT
jgi:diacylglycerol kinase (ATP)